MQKVTVVIDFYRKWKTLALVAWGLRANGAHIEEVILVNDELWDTHGRELALFALNGLPVRLLDHEHNGFGAHRCIKQGVHAARTDLVLHTDGDNVLARGAVETLVDVAERELLVSPQLVDAYRTATVDMLDGAREKLVEREDWRLTAPHPHVYAHFRDSAWICYKEDYEAMGGHDPRYRHYGLVDYDFGCRWALEYGGDSWMLEAGAEVYHIGGVDRPEDKVGKEPHADNIARFEPVKRRFLRDVLGYVSA